MAGKSKPQGDDTQRDGGQPSDYLLACAQESAQAREVFVREHGDRIVAAARCLGKCVDEGGKILILGNGGSAADAQHMAAEMVGRLLIDRRPLPAIALTTDSSNLTALSNDFGYDAVFSKQVEALARKGDVLVAFSTSGNSRSILMAVEQARALGCRVVGLTGGSGGKLAAISDIHLNVAEGRNSSRIQESHIFAIHLMVDLLDRFFLSAR